MKQRQPDQRGGVRVELQVGLGGPLGTGEIQMGEQHSLGGGLGTGGVDHHRRIIGQDEGFRLMVRLGVVHEGLDVGPAGGRRGAGQRDADKMLHTIQGFPDGLDVFDQHILGNEHSGFTVIDHVFNFLSLVQPVDRHHHRTEFQEGKPSDDHQIAIVGQNGDTVSLADAPGGQPVGQPVDTPVEFTIVVLAVPEFQRGLAGRAHRLVCQNVPHRSAAGQIGGQCVVPTLLCFLHIVFLSSKCWRHRKNNAPQMGEPDGFRATVDMYPLGTASPVPLHWFYLYCQFNKL